VPTNVRATLERLSPWADARGLGESLPRWIAQAADPAAAAVNFEVLLGAGWDPKPNVAEAVICVCGASPALTTVLLSVPGVDAAWFEKALALDSRSPAEHVAELSAAAASPVAPELSALLRRHKRRHVLRIGARDLLGLAPITETVRELSALAQGAIEVASRYARLQVAADYGESVGIDPLRFVVLAMGKLGGEELNFSSDIDLIYLFDGGSGQTSGGSRRPVGGASFATRMAEIITRALSEVSADGLVFRVDLRLRPDGQNGPIVNSVTAALSYYEALGQTW